MIASPRVGGVVLAFRPEPDIVANIDALRAQASVVYVVVNAPDESSRQVLAPLGEEPDVVILEQDGNVGVAAGFNAGMRAALADDCDFVWIFDQDSTVTDGMLPALLAAHRSVPSGAGVFAPALRSHATGIVYRRESGSGFGEADVLISSGSLFSRELIERIGLHDEALFIDYVDHDICLRARKAGFHNYKVYGVLLDHRFGASHPVHLVGRTIYLSDYSPMRHYYSARNRMIMVRRFGVGRWFWEDAWFTTKSWVKVLLFERGRREKVGAFLRGARDGLRGPVS